MRASRRLAAATAALAVAGVLPQPAAAGATRCLAIGAYEDRPLAELPGLERAVGRLDALQVYVGSGERVPADVVALARRRRIRLVVAYVPTGVVGAHGASPVAAIAGGALDGEVRRLVRDLRGVLVPPVLRPLPEANAPWYPWGVGQRGSTAAGYGAAFRRIVRVVRGTRGGRRLTVLWSPSARSYPDVPGNGIADVFPGRGWVDAVGASIANVGTAGGHAWEEPQALFGDAYAATTALAPGRPFWIAETASVEDGGDKAVWIGGLAVLRRTMPRLAGVLWYDVADGVGDFRIRSSAASTAAFTTMLRGRCRA